MAEFWIVARGLLAFMSESNKTHPIVLSLLSQDRLGYMVVQKQFKLLAAYVSGDVFLTLHGHFKYNVACIQVFLLLEPGLMEHGQSETWLGFVIEERKRG